MNKETEIQQDEGVSPEALIKPGTLLRQKRESLNLTQQQVADKLRLRITLIQSLEDNNFNIDKVKTFTRGYVRSYARFVGIEESVILASYDAYCGAEPQDLDMKSFSKRTKREQHNSRINYITFGIILVVVGISSVWWLQNQEKDSLLEFSSDVAVSGAGSSADKDFATVTDLISQDDPQMTMGESVTDDNSSAMDTRSEPPLNPVEQADVKAGDGMTGEDTTANETGVSVRKPVTADEESASVTNERTSPVITMAFIDECWVQIKDATGKTLTVGLKKPGQVVSLDGVAPFKVILGAPESVSMTFQSEPVDLSRYTSGKVARFTLP